GAWHGDDRRADPSRCPVGRTRARRAGGRRGYRSGTRGIGRGLPGLGALPAAQAGTSPASPSRGAVEDLGGRPGEVVTPLAPNPIGRSSGVFDRGFIGRASFGVRPRVGLRLLALLLQIVLPVGTAVEAVHKARTLAFFVVIHNLCRELVPPFGEQDIGSQSADHPSENERQPQ